MGVILRAHPVRGESHIQRNTSREVATTCMARRRCLCNCWGSVKQLQGAWLGTHKYSPVSQAYDTNTR